MDWIDWLLVLVPLWAPIAAAALCIIYLGKRHAAEPAEPPRTRQFVRDWIWDEHGRIVGEAMLYAPDWPLSDRAEPIHRIMALNDCLRGEEK